MDLDDLRPITKDLDLERSPRYRIGEVAKVFFAKSPHWVRWRERTDAFVIDGERWGPERAGGSNLKARDYDLGDIEVMARLLYKGGAISRRDHGIALSIVVAQAELYRLGDDNYILGGVNYDLDASDVAGMAMTSTDWVYRHTDALGGVKRNWDDGMMAESWRFPSDEILKRIAKVSPPLGASVTGGTAS